MGIISEEYKQQNGKKEKELGQKLRMRAHQPVIELE